MSGTKYAGLDIIRALAALIVVYSHIFGFELVLANPTFTLQSAFATEAVMVFFVLSGVVVTLSAEGQSHTTTDRTRLALNYMKARLVRIYPIFAIGLLASVLVQRVITAEWPHALQITGAAFFLQSLHGYIVNVPSFNAPLWSLSCEMTYYVLFAFSLLWGGWAMAVWCIIAVVTSVFFYSSAQGGVSGHLVYVLSLSIPWLMGHFVVKLRHNGPKIPVSLGVLCLFMGLIFFRCPLNHEGYDIFSMSAFSLACCPLMLAIIQNNKVNSNKNNYFMFRASVALVALSLLWTISHSLTAVKLTLSVASVVAAVIPLYRIDNILTVLGFLSRPLVYIGSVSYAIYVIHTPIIHLIKYYMPDRGAVSGVVVFAFVTLAISIFLERVIQPRLTRRFNGSVARIAPHVADDENPEFINVMRSV